MNRKIIYKYEMSKYKVFTKIYKDNTKTELRYILRNNSKAFIWIHGFNDYYFHFNIDNKLVNDSFDIFAITLRGYGQTVQLINKDKLFNIDTLDKYIIDIDSNLHYIIEILKKDYNEIVLYSHSLGGLVSSVYLNKGKYRNKITKLVLNSPFYDFRKFTLFDNLAFNYIIPFIGIFRKLKLINNLCLKIHNGIDPYRSFIFDKYYYDKELKVNYKKIYLDWVLAVLEYQKIIKNNKCNSNIPILILYCDKNISSSDILNNDLGDDILNINDITYYSQIYFNNLTLKKISNSIHDIFCSDKNVVDKSYNFMINWIENNLKFIKFKKVNKNKKKHYDYTFIFYLLLFLLLNLFFINNYNGI